MGKKGQQTIESLLIVNGQSGDHFYTDKEDKHITALASYYKRKIVTERLIATTTGKDPKAKYITKVTLR